MSKKLSAFVEDALGVTFSETGTHPMNLQELVGLSIRRNPKRAHLLVSEVLGKHIPQRPEVIAFAGRLLGEMVSNVLNDRAETHGLDYGFEVLSHYLETGYWSKNNSSLLENKSNSRTVVSIGYAETATSLGFLVADQIRSWYIHSTRSFDDNTVAYGNFEESHSHATSHQLIPSDPSLLNAGLPVVLIDDEFSTGKTVINTITELHGVSPHPEYVVAALIDCRREADRIRMEEFALSLGVKITVVALASGEVSVPAEALTLAPSIIDQHATVDLTKPEIVYSPRLDVHPAETDLITVPVDGTKLSRFGVMPDEYMSKTDAGIVAFALGQTPGKTMVLGTEEFMYFPLLVAEALATQSHDGEIIHSSSTTQSPVAVIERDDYAINNGISFMSPQTDGTLAKRFAYNIAKGYNRIVVILEPGEDIFSMMGHDGLISILQKITNKLVIVSLEKKEN